MAVMHADGTPDVAGSAQFRCALCGSVKHQVLPACQRHNELVIICEFSES